MDIKRLEALSKLELNEIEREKCEKEIDEVIEYFNILSTLDTEGIEPLTHHFDIKNVLRADTVKPSVSVSDIIANAESEDGFFVTPKATEG